MHIGDKPRAATVRTTDRRNAYKLYPPLRCTNFFTWRFDFRTTEFRYRRNTSRSSNPPQMLIGPPPPLVLRAGHEKEVTMDLAMRVNMCAAIVSVGFLAAVVLGML